MKKVAVILAGGYGERLWPKSVESKPKQFSYFLGNGTLIEDTFNRIKKIYPISDIFVVSQDEYKPYISEQIPELLDENIITEPFARNTAPAIALTNIIIESRYGNECIITIFPSDHYIRNEEEFKNSIHLSCKAAFDKFGVVAVGVEPTRPATNYGYIQINNDRFELGELYDAGIRRSTTFAEKPDIETAKRFLDSGDFLWNSGIYSWRISSFWTLYEKYLPDDAYLMSGIKSFVGTDNFDLQITQIYQKIQDISIDYGLMERINKLYVIKASFAWSDIGTWDEYWRLSIKDANSNVLEGEVAMLNSTGCLVVSQEKPISIIGMDNVVAIESEGGILICKRGQSSQVKNLLDYIRKHHITNLK